ncbi:MAG: hypothetical protein QM726_09340 [Chitinophagaceae bacterium]
MKPLIVLLSVFVIALFVLKIMHGEYEPAYAARIAMSVMLMFTAIAHFKFTKGMAMMLPGFIPFKTAMVYLTGVIEILAAIGLQIAGWSVVTAWLLMLFFIIILSANIYAAVQKVDYEKATLEGKGIRYLWFRVPLQILFIVWTYFSCIVH